MNWGKQFLLILLLSTTVGYGQETTAEEKEGAIATMDRQMAEHTEKTRAQWNYNPFRKSDTERKLVGWMDPNNFITSLWVGDLLSKHENFTDPNWQLDKVSMFYSMKIGTEVNPISFTINNFTFRLGVAFFADIQLLVYNGEVTHVYGEDLIISDYMRINMHFDFLWGDKLKFRWTPMYHECAHISGDYMGDPGFRQNGKNEIGDLGIEGMGFELYYNWGFFTFYGGFNFTYQGIDTDAYATLFGFKVGTDMRIPIWGQINFITGIHLGANYDLVQTRTTGDPMGAGHTLTSSYKKWYPVVGIGIGFEFDRFIIGMKYSLMRSRHIISHETMEEKIGVDISIFF